MRVSVENITCKARIDLETKKTIVTATPHHVRTICFFRATPSTNRQCKKALRPRSLGANLITTVSGILRCRSFLRGKFKFRSLVSLAWCFLAKLGPYNVSYLHAWSSRVIPPTPPPPVCSPSVLVKVSAGQFTDAPLRRVHLTLTPACTPFEQPTSLTREAFCETQAIEGEQSSDQGTQVGLINF